VSVAAKASRTEVARIGVLSRGEGVIFQNEKGDAMNITSPGFDHFGK